jgi:arylsulfatase A-like enzyme
LIELLREEGVYNHTLIVLTADHGESFLEHNVWSHGRTLYQQEIRVPLIIHFPDSFDSGKKVLSAGRHIDIFPTILDWIGLSVPPGVQGHSLLPLMQSGKTVNTPIYCELVLDQADKRAVVLGQYKLIQNNDEVQPNRFTSWYELFDLKTDPMERLNLLTSRPILFGYLRSMLIEWSDSQTRRKSILKKPKGAVLDPETEETLKALGYLQ